MAMVWFLLVLTIHSDVASNVVVFIPTLHYAGIEIHTNTWVASHAAANHDQKSRQKSGRMTRMTGLLATIQTKESYHPKTCGVYTKHAPARN
jgi:hypothetical protein